MMKASIGGAAAAGLSAPFRLTMSAPERCIASDSDRAGRFRFGQFCPVSGAVRDGPGGNRHLRPE
ncbi:hypothetical protein [Roseicyclus marinus]|uniref:hypothetical protein n=1 Tax=Roseicyclus marinus TaxID=2161673 RepID=UPI00240ED940|nr:hypothetical protein [Roseicyclus marinus]MDG3040321.1 hypothetical protein [Roseicyclus marinus]